MAESVLRLAGLYWRVTDFSTVCRRQKTLQVQLPYRASTTALDPLVDSTGIKFLGEGEWRRKKHGAEYRRQWRKVHLGIDAQTLEIRAIEVTDNSVGDAPMLPELLAQIPPDEAVASVSADGAYDTKACHAAIVQRGAQAGIRHLEEVERSPPQKPGGRPKCTASSAWASGSWRARLSVRWQSYMCAWHCSTASSNSGARPRCPWSLWHSCVWGWGHLVPLSTCATKPLDGSSSSTAFCLG